MLVSIHVAVAANGVIGRGGELPWRLSTDLKRFKADTMGKSVVMGRKTYDSIGKPLPGRQNIVLTRDAAFRRDGVEVVRSIDEALRLAQVRRRCLPGEAEACVIGGGEIFAEAMPLADRLHVTHVLADVEGDTFLPAIDPELWQPANAIEVPSGDKDSHPTRHVVYQRIRKR